jgi:hypothetical protein
MLLRSLTEAVDHNHAGRSRVVARFQAQNGLVKEVGRQAVWETLLLIEVLRRGLARFEKKFVLRIVDGPRLKAFKKRLTK